ncbi:MAG TPA: EamA family transporter RarD [Burkholderiaceae bacterium]|nr:EamA family transporter RarD [Burkholderiaceae bacterium]
MRTGVLYAVLAYIMWGLFPVYFKALQAIQPVEILMHRMLWSLAFVLAVLALRRQWAWLRPLLGQPKVLAGFTLSAILLAGNWLLYIWAVNSGHVIDASLGYFINPLVSILLGLLLLQERLRPVQWMAVALAAAGVAWLTWQAGHPPWIGLALAISFGGYGLLRKTAVLGPLEGLSLETLLLFPLALGYFVYLTINHQNTFLAAPAHLQWLLLAAGPITAVPLLLFAAGARRIPLSLMGLLQYLSPSLQLLLGVWLYHEPFDAVRMTGFALIWSGLALYSAEGLWRGFKSRVPGAAA